MVLQPPQTVGNSTFQGALAPPECMRGWLSYRVPARSLQVMTLFNRTKELVKAGGTRFGTNTLVGQRLLELKPALQQTVVDPDYVAQKYQDLPDDVEVSNCGTKSRQNKGGTAKALVLDDVSFWPGVQAHVLVTEPIYKLLRRHDRLTARRLPSARSTTASSLWASTSRPSMCPTRRHWSTPSMRDGRTATLTSSLLPTPWTRSTSTTTTRPTRR